MRIYFGVYANSPEQLEKVIKALDEVGADYDSDIEWGHRKQMICDKCGGEFREHEVVDNEYQIDDKCTQG